MSQTNILLESGTNELEIVEFYIDEIAEDGEVYRGHYGINVAKVVEIIRPQDLTLLPSNTKKGLVGMFPLRDGNVIPLIDLAKFFSKNSQKVKEPKLIVTEFNKTQAAFLVSGVNRIFRLSWEDIEAPDKLVQDASGDYITSVVRIEQRVILVLDFEAIVANMIPELAMKSYVLPELESGEKYQKFRIVHAEDSRSIRKMVMSILEKDQRFEVEQFEDGQLAYDYLDGLKKQAQESNVPINEFVDGIITDIEMPNLDGFTFCKQIKDDPILKVLPVAIFSSLITASTTHKAESVGADAQYAKPDLKDLADKIYDLMLSKQAK